MHLYPNLLVLAIVQTTGLVKAQGPICTGQTLGEASPEFATSTAGPNTGATYVMLGNSMKVPCCGTISSWGFASKAAGDITLQVWRPQAGNLYKVLGETAKTGECDAPRRGNRYKVLGETAKTGVTAGGKYTEGIGVSQQTSIEQNDIIGWHSSGADIVGVVTTGSAIMGRVTIGGKTAVGGTQTLPGPAVVGEQWMFNAVLEQNAVPSLTGLPTTVTAKTSDALNAVVYTATPTDANTDDVASLVVGMVGTSEEFKLSGNEVQVKRAPLTIGTHEVVLTVADHCKETATATVTITVLDSAPVITSLPIAAVYLKEGSTTASLLHTLTFTDDGPLANVKCTMTGTPAAAPFSLQFIENTSNYGIYYKPQTALPLDYDVTNLYKFSVVCNDGTSDSDAREFQVSLLQNEPPVPTVPTEISVSAKTTKKTDLVQTITSTDTENDALIYTMTCTGPCTGCTCPFTMDPSGKITATETLNAHRLSPYVAKINVSDPFNVVGEKTMTIKITDINTPPNITDPTKTLPSTDETRVSEHTVRGVPNAKGATVSVFKALGSDTDGDAITWEFKFDNGQGEQLFDANTATGEITTKTDLDYETLATLGLLTTRVEVRAYDGREYSEETRVVNIIVDDVNEEPSFNQKKYAIDTKEGFSNPTLTCPLFDITDEDRSDTRTYDINCGAVGHFHIPTTRTQTCDAFIEQTAEHDLDTPGAANQVVSCVITVTDKGGLTATTTLEITVHEEDDNPPVLDKTAYTYTISNDTTPGTTFGNADATDKDFLPEHKRHTYSTDSSDFGVDNNGVFFSKIDWTGISAPTSRTFNLKVTDEAGHTDTAPVTVNIVDIPTTTTSTTTTTTLASVYDRISSFADDPGNLAWLIAALILSLLALGLLAFMISKCCAAGACARMCGGGRCFNGASRRRLAPRRTVVRAPPKRVVQRTAPARTTPTKVVRPIQTAKPVQTQPKGDSGFFDCFKKKPPAAKNPATDDGNRVFHLWNHGDFSKPQKWVG